MQELSGKTCLVAFKGSPSEIQEHKVEKVAMPMLRFRDNGGPYWVNANLIDWIRVAPRPRGDRFWSKVWRR